MDVTSTTAVPLQVMTQAVSGTSTGTITVSIVDGADYALGDPISVSTSVTDSTPAQGGKPVVSLVGIPSHVTLGHEFDFTIRAEPAPASNIVTNLALTYGLDEDLEDVGTTFNVTDSNGMAITLVNGEVPITIPTTSGVVELKIVTDAALAQQTSVDIGTPAAFFTK